MPKFRNIRIKKPGGGFRMQRAQVLRSGKLKFVKNKPRGGGRKKTAAKKTRRAPRRAVAKKTTRRRSVAKKKGNPGHSSPKIGASIQAFKGAQAVAAPLVEVGVRVNAGEQVMPALQRVANLNTAGSLIVEGVNQAVDRKIAQGSALTGGSITAWAPEAFAAVRAFDSARGSSAVDAARQINISLSRTIRAYDPQSSSVDFGNADFRTYQTLKIGGGIFRRLSNMGPFKKILAPAKKLLSSFGGRL